MMFPATENGMEIKAICMISCHNRVECHFDINFATFRILSFSLNKPTITMSNTAIYIYIDSDKSNATLRFFIMFTRYILLPIAGVK